MPRTWLAIALVVGTLGFAPRPAFAQGQVTSCSPTSKNLQVRDILTDLYYWYEFLPAVDPARYDSPEAYLEAVRYRPLDSSYSYVTSRAASEAFFSESQFIGYGLSTAVEGGEMRVLQVFDGSPAAEAGLARGHRIVEIDGQPVAALVAHGLIGQAFGPAEAGVASDVVFETREGEPRSARLTKRLVTIPTVSLTRLYEVDGRRVGYVFFRNFVRPSIAALDEAFATLREARAEELVLDLRYNGGGLVDVAIHLASLVGGRATSGQVLARYVHNAKNHAYDETLRFEDAAHALDLSRLVVIASRGSASASELLVSALRPYMPVTVVGDRTYGKPVGQYAMPVCDKVVAPVAFSIRNASDEGDYYDGIPADCPAADDVTHDLGDPQEASLAEALVAIRTGGCTAAADALVPLRTRRAPAPAPATGWQSVVNAW